MNHGFTLIELAIVIVIAAILAAVAIPIYQGIVNDSKWSEAETKMGSISTAVDVKLARDATFNSNTLTEWGVEAVNGTYFLATDYTIDCTTAATLIDIDCTKDIDGDGTAGVLARQYTRATKQWGAIAYSTED